MKTSAKRTISLLIAIGLFLGAVILYSSFIRSSYDNIMALRAEILAKKENLIKFQATVSKAKSFLDQLGNADEVKSQVSLVLPNEKNISYFTNQIIELARINGLFVESVATKIPPVQSSKSSVLRDVGRIQAEIKMSGTYAGFKSWIKQIESNVLIIDLTDFRIDGSLTEQKDTLQYIVSAVSYYQE